MIISVARSSLGKGRSEFGGVERAAGGGDLSRSEAHSSPERSASTTAMADGNATTANSNNTGKTGSKGLNRHHHHQQQQQGRSRESVYLKKGLKAARSSISAGSPVSSSAFSISAASVWWPFGKQQPTTATAFPRWMTRLIEDGVGLHTAARTSCQMALAWLLLLLFWP